MAKIYLDRLRKKYDGVKVSGNVYSDLVKQIIEENTRTVQNKVLKVSNEKFSIQAKKYRAREIRLVLPDLSDLLPKRSISVRKAAEKGDLIRDTLRDSLTKSLRDSLNTFSEKTGEQTFVTRRGALAGRINKKLIEGFEKDITQVFSNYVKRDKTFGMPKNIHTIAVTETRSTINEIKKSYVSRFLEKNPNIEIRKKWIQNKSLAKESRKGHTSVDGTIVKFGDFFKVPRYKMIKGVLKKIGVTLMEHPHDPRAPLDQVISCNCDYDIIVTKRAG